MAKACGSMYAAYDHPLKAPDPTSKEALTYALLETVRMVLEGQESDDDKQAVTDNHGSHSDHTSSDAYTDPPAPRPPPPARKPSPKGGILGGPCAHCGATESPQWRRPLTKKVVLCNACGIYYSRHHSLPKRKKAPGLRHTTLEDIESKIEDSGNEDSDVRGSQRGARASTPMSDPMACDVSMPVRQQSNLGPAAAMRQDSILSEALHLKPIVTHRMQQESAVSAEGAAQQEERKAHTQPTQTPTHSMACASPMAQSLSMACMSPAASCGSPMHPAAQHPSGIAAPPTTPKKRPDDQIDALFDAQEMSLAKRAIKRAAAAAVAAASQAAATTSSTPAISTGTSTPVEQVIDPNNANFYVAPPMGVGRRAILTASLAASVGMQMPASMQHQLHQPLQQQQQHQVQQQQQHQVQQQQQHPQQHPQHPPHMGSAAMPMHHHMGMPRMSIIETLMHQQSQARMAAARPPSNAAAVHAFSALPGILMTTGNPGFHPQPQPTFTGHLRPVTTALSEQSGDSDAGMILLPVSTCRGPPSKPGSQQGSPVCGSRY